MCLCVCVCVCVYKDVPLEASSAAAARFSCVGFSSTAVAMFVDDQSIDDDETVVCCVVYVCECV
jgi:hypothetical protein